MNHFFGICTPCISWNNFSGHLEQRGQVRPVHPGPAADEGVAGGEGDAAHIQQVLGRVQLVTGGFLLAMP